MKQTAVEQFIEQLEQQGDSWKNAFRRINISIKVEDYLKLIEQAKEMEKEQMIDFLDSIMDYTKESHNILGVSDDREAKDYFEQYYNETFKSE